MTLPHTSSILPITFYRLFMVEVHHGEVVHLKKNMMSLIDGNVFFLNHVQVQAILTLTKGIQG